MQFVKDMGLSQHEMATPDVQSTFADEYHRAKRLFKGLVEEGDGEPNMDCPPTRWP